MKLINEIRKLYLELQKYKIYKFKYNKINSELCNLKKLISGREYGITNE